MSELFSNNEILWAKQQMSYHERQGVQTELNNFKLNRDFHTISQPI